MCLRKFFEEVHEIVSESLLAKVLSLIFPFTIVCMLFYPIRCVISDPSNLDCIIGLALVGTLTVCILGIAIGACCSKPKPLPPNVLPSGTVVIPPSPSARAPILPTIQEDQEHFIADNPLHATEHAPVSPPRSSRESRTAASPRSSRGSHIATSHRETDVESQSE